MRFFSSQQQSPPPSRLADPPLATAPSSAQLWHYLLALLPLQLVILAFSLPHDQIADPPLSAAGLTFIGDNRTLLLAAASVASLILFLLALRHMQQVLRQHAADTAELRHSREQLRRYAEQTEQFSLSAAAMLSIKDESQLFIEISQAIVTHSDYCRVLISLFDDSPPYRRLIGHAGVAPEIVARVKATDLHKSWYDQVFAQGIRLGRASYYIPQAMKHILNQEATFYGEGPEAQTPGWHPEDNLFVRMDDENGEFLGVISVDTSKSGKKPTNEIIRPLEIYASLISQILALRRNQKMRDELQERLRQAQKMEVIGKLTGGIAHDFNNILAIIIGNVELAEIQLPDSHPTRENLAEICKASFRARDIVRHLLAYSRKSPDELQPLRLNEILRDAIALLRSSLPSSVTIVEEIASEEVIVLANPTQFQEMLLNLGSNAGHAMEKVGGRLTISLSLEEVKNLTDTQGMDLVPGRYAVITVADTGEGIPQEILPRIFDPYFTTKKFGKGCGMGLAIVHGIVRGHSGAVQVASVPGQGTTVSVYLPLHHILEEQQVHDVTSGGNQRLLLVDDDRALLAATAERLRRHGYRVEAVADPKQALELFSAAPSAFDLLITDMTMPVMTGDILASRMLALRPNFPVILCTGYSESIDGEQAARLGIRRYLEKPITAADLTRAVHQELQGRAN